MDTNIIKNCVRDICNILNMDVPRISYDTSHFQSKTKMSQCNSSGTAIFIRNPEKLNPDFVFSIARELRHIWQIHTDKKLYLSKYKTRDLCETADEYNLQLAEIDANAFGTIALTELYHLKPTFSDFSENAKKCIQERIPIIIEQLQKSK